MTEGIEPALCSGSGEEFKAAIHLGIFGLVVTCLAYNALAYSQRKERHLLANVVVYTGLVAFEVYQMDRHWKDR